MHFPRNCPYSILFILASACLYSCNSVSSSPEIIPGEDENIIYLAEDSEINRQAMDSVRANLATFTDLFAQFGEDPGYGFYVKTPFSDAADVEHMWSVVLSMSDDSLLAELDNEPAVVTNVSYGDQVNLSQEEIEDFLVYKDDSILLGNYFEKIRE